MILCVLAFSQQSFLLSYPARVATSPTVCVTSAQPWRRYESTFFAIFKVVQLNTFEPQFRRIPALHSHMVGLEISLGLDHTIDFEDVLGGL